VKYAFIKTHTRRWPVGLLCRVLAVSRSGYYAWRQRPAETRVVWRHRVLLEIRRSFLESRRTYGSPRIHQELVARGLSCCVNTVAGLMKTHHIQAQTRRGYRVKTTDSSHPHPVAANRLDRCFTQPAANKAWAADITYVPTREGWLYLAVILDLYSRRVVGWAMADHLKAVLASDALEMALQRRTPPAGLLLHSDRGVQYACGAYQELLARHGLVCSMSRAGNCYDNAVVESFHGTLKSELVRRQDYATRAQAIQAIFEYIEVFYNRQRRHSTLGYKSPVDFEDSA
jgi:transposase InsO family protein